MQIAESHYAAAQYSVDHQVNMLTGKYNESLYHYISNSAADDIMKSQLGITEDSWVYLTPDGAKTAIQAQLDLSLPSDNSAQSLIKIKPNSVYPNNFIIQRTVNGNVYGRPGGGYEFIYKGTIDAKYLLRLK